jgi:hypothetical protein
VAELARFERLAADVSVVTDAGARAVLTRDADRMIEVIRA